MITNASGEIAITYYQPTGKYIRLGNGHEYVFRTTRDVCLAWIRPEDVEAILQVVRECCGGSKHKICRYSSQQEVNIWTGIGDFHPQ